MAGTRHKSRTAAAAIASGPSTTAGDFPDPLRWIWLALVSGLFFVRWWQPAEGTVWGDTLGIAVGWFLALALAGWNGVRGTSWRWRWDAWQGAIALLVVGHVASGLWIVCTIGERRSALNMVWEWVALGVSFPLLRSALSRRETRREWIVISLAAVITLSGYGLTQRYIYYPRLVAEYERVRSELDELESAAASGTAVNMQRIQKLRAELLGSGMSPNMLVGSGRKLFEDRLKHSTEALGRFALANTFAGLLLAWWGVLIVLTLRQWLRPRAIDGPEPAAARAKDRLRNVLVLIASLTVGYCLLLTKSRTAYVGAIVCLSVWSLSTQSGRFRSVRQIVSWGLLALLAAGGLALLAGLTGSLDRLVLAEAPKSLQYRLEYWWSSLQVVRESPVLGVGPGQFRQHYLAHKLPRSSEEIADPHNLFLDVWANGGLVSLVGLTWFAYLIARQALGKANGLPSVSRTTAKAPAPCIPLAPTVRESGIPPAPVQKTPQPKVAQRNDPAVPDVTAGCSTGWRSPLRWGALGSLVALWIIGGAMESLLLVLLFVWVAAIEIVSFILPERFDWGSTWGAVGLGLLIHLCGAGGIAMPVIEQLLMLIAILSLDHDQLKGLQLRPWQLLCLLVSGIGLFIAGYVTGVQPAGTCRWLCSQGDFSNAPERIYRQATQADPLSPEPWEKLAELSFQKWRTERDPDDRDFQQAVDMTRNARERNPFSFHPYQTLGLLYAEKAKRSGLAEDKVNAVNELRAALTRYPHSASLLADAALVFQVAGEAELAKETARRTLEQDDINHAAGHTDKWLNAKLRSDIEKLAGNN